MRCHSPVHAPSHWEININNSDFNAKEQARSDPPRNLQNVELTNRDPRARSGPAGPEGGLLHPGSDDQIEDHRIQPTGSDPARPRPGYVPGWRFGPRPSRRLVPDGPEQLSGAQLAHPPGRSPRWSVGTGRQPGAVLELPVDRILKPAAERNRAPGYFPASGAMKRVWMPP